MHAFEGNPMLKKSVVLFAGLVPALAFAHAHAHFSHFYRHAPEIDGGVAVLGLAILGGILSFMKKKEN